MEALSSLRTIIKEICLASAQFPGQGLWRRQLRLKSLLPDVSMKGGYSLGWWLAGIIYWGLRRHRWGWLECSPSLTLTHLMQGLTSRTEQLCGPGAQGSTIPRQSEGQDQTAVPAWPGYNPPSRFLSQCDQDIWCKQRRWDLWTCYPRQGLTLK